ncbi:MAG: hypothetical protein VKK03_03770 [Synechococcus sp.]|nr:hypothetical protein [Synechococcus sp.]
MLVYLGLSSHGFGHAARQAAVLAALHRLHPHWRLVVSSAVDPAFLQLVFRGIPVTFRFCRWDVGMVQADALSCDQEATLAALDRLEQSLPTQICEEAAWISSEALPVLVMGDIPPALARLAQRIGAPLIWLGNFGWDDIYGEQGNAFAPHVISARTDYRSGDLLLRMPFDLPMDWGIPECSIGLTAARPRPLPQAVQESLAERAQERVLVGFGGLGMRIDPELFHQWPDHQFLLPAPLDAAVASDLAALANVSFLPQGFRPVDAMPHCHRLLGKPGFSTFSEALSTGIGLHVVERSGFAEASALITGLRRHGWHRLLSRSAFDQGQWELNMPLEQPLASPLPVDGAEKAAQAISTLARSNL